MHSALDVLEAADLESQDTLRAYIKEIKQLYRVQKFAFIDANGTVYTEFSTSSGRSRYDFLMGDITEPLIRTINLYGAKKQVIIAMPVSGIEFNGVPIHACFMQVKIDQMLTSVVLQEQDASTYINFYHRNGENLTNSVLGPFDSYQNFLTAMSTAQIADGYSYEQLEEDFKSGRQGQIAFTYDGSSNYVYYVPIEDTNWMLTVLVGTNVISEQINNVSQGMLLRGWIQIGVTVLSMLVVFLVIVYQSQKSHQALLAKEKADGARIRDALDQAEWREREMEGIHEALGSGPWRMEFTEEGDMLSCTWSNTFRKMIGYTSKADFPDVFESWVNILHEDDRARVLDAYWDCVRDYSGKTPYDVEYRVRTKREGVRWFHSSGTLTRRADGSPITFFGLFVDVNDQKRAQIEVVEALDTAKRANAAKSTFLSNMSHDIRTPMNAIIGFSQLILRDVNDPERVTDQAQKILTSSNHLLGLINDVLDMSKIESGAISLSEGEFRLADTVATTEAIMRPQMEEKHQTFDVSMTGVRHTTFAADNQHLQQILINILSNATKYTPEGGHISFTVTRAGERSDNYETIAFTVADDGRGMSEDYQKIIFEPFSREQLASQDAAQGTGLGMAITKNLVELMGGTITLKSVLGQGSTFVVTVPLMFAADENDGALPDTGALGPEGEDDASIAGLNILAAEDNALNSEILLEVLKMSGATVTVAPDGGAVVKRFVESPVGTYDLILMDIQMPVCDGYEATRRIRAMEDDWQGLAVEKREEAATIPIIAMTANAFSDDVQHALEAGMNAHVAKPLDVDRLKATIVAQLHREGR